MTKKFPTLKTTYMLDTNICSFILRPHSPQVLQNLQLCSDQRHRIVISAVTYAELRFGAIGKKASPKHNIIVNEFLERVDAVLAWDQASVDETVTIKKYLSDRGITIGNNDVMIAGHAISELCVLVTNNTREFDRVPGLEVEDWV